MPSTWPTPNPIVDLPLQELGQLFVHGTISSFQTESLTYRRVKGNCTVISYLDASNLSKYRYANMDYAFFSAMQHSTYKALNVSYDIACQWHKNLWARMSALPSSLQMQHTDMHVRFFVPKFHLPAHISKCHILYSFNFLPGVGRTDGEAPERGWSSINPAASSTKEMGPGSRRDTLDDYFGDWNWKKVTGLGKL